MDLLVNLGLLAIFLLVLVLPFKVKQVEHNLEVFLFACGVLALTIAGFMTIPGETTGWSLKIIEEALLAPLNITTLFGIPVALVPTVLLVGILTPRFHHPLESTIMAMIPRFPPPATVFCPI